MLRMNLTLAAGSVLALAALGCSDSGKALNLTNPATLPPNGVLAGDTHLTILQTTDVHDHVQGEGPLTAGLPAAMQVAAGWGTDASAQAVPGQLLAATDDSGALGQTPAVFGGYLGSSGGYGRISAYVANVRAAADAGHPVVLVDSGDWTMGTYYDLALTQFPVALMNLAIQKYDCVALGDHEFDWTSQGLAGILATPTSAASVSADTSFTFNVPIVATNLTPDANLAPFYAAAQPAALTAPTILPTYVEKLANGLTIGYVGLMGAAARANVANAGQFTGFSDYTAQNYAALQATVNTLRTAQGCHIVIALSHAGTDPAGATGEDIALAQSVSGIDVIASGHSHNALAAPSSVPGPNGWTTQVISAGAMGTNVFRLDLTYHFAAKNTTVDTPTATATNPGANYLQPMTDAYLQQVEGWATANPANLSPLGASDASYFTLVGQIDPMLNGGLGAIFSSSLLSPLFPGYSGNLANPYYGLYQAVGGTAQDMASNLKASPVPPPNGLGNFVADGDWFLANYMAANGLLADPTPFAAAVTTNNTVFDSLSASGAISFGNLYDVSALGISPLGGNTPLPMGYPLVSTYVDLGGLKTLAAAQLMAQTGLVPAADYPHLSGFTYTLTNGGYTYFKNATAAMVLQTAQAKAGGGSAQAGQALMDLVAWAQSGGSDTSLAGDISGGNPYAVAMGMLNDADQSNQVANLMVCATFLDPATNANQVITQAAIGDLASVTPNTDPLNEVPAAAALPAGYYRLTGNFYTISLVGQLGAQLGVPVTLYSDNAGGTAVDPDTGMPASILQVPGSGGLEVKEWLSGLAYLGLGLGGAIPADYASSQTFSDWLTNPSAFGPAVSARAAAYPAAGIVQFLTTYQTLQTAN